jgi:hypothetical protein
MLGGADRAGPWSGLAPAHSLAARHPAGFFLLSGGVKGFPVSLVRVQRYAEVHLSSVLHHLSLFRIDRKEDLRLIIGQSLDIFNVLKQERIINQLCHLLDNNECQMCYSRFFVS